MPVSLTTNFKKRNFLRILFKKLPFLKTNTTFRFSYVYFRPSKILRISVKCFLEEVYEKNVFLSSSHGFRKKKSVHSAFKQIKSWKNVDWIIKGKILNHFDVLDITRFKGLSSRLVDSTALAFLDQTHINSFFLKLIRHAFKQVDFFSYDSVWLLLFNVLLHEFDFLMNDFLQLIKKDAASFFYPCARTMFLLKLREFRNGYPWKKLVLSERSKKLKALFILEKAHSIAAVSEDFNVYIHTIQYIRYANVFLIGVKGKYSCAYSIKNLIASFLEHSFNMKKSLKHIQVINVFKNNVYFLRSKLKLILKGGWNFLGKDYVGSLFKKEIKEKNCSTKLDVSIPLQVVIRWLSKQGFCILVKQHVIPQKKVTWLNLSVGSILLKYNHVWINQQKTYALSNNYIRLRFVRYLLRHSLACTLMQKLKISSRFKVFKMFECAL